MPAFFIPARNSRHRTACLALYRALLRQVPAVPLPDDLATRFGRVNPVKFFIQRAFRRNRADTSPRLVTSALQSGYRFLDVLYRAKSPTSPDNASITSFLRDRLAALQAKAALPPKPPRPSTAPKPGTIPLLTRVASPPVSSQINPPLTPPRYAATVRPLPRAQLKGRRLVPKLTSCHDIPFLRLGGPQSPVLSRVLRQKFRRRERRTTALVALDGHGREAARWEDEWEDALVREAGLEREERGRQDRQGVDGGGPPSSAATFSRGVGTVVWQLSDQLNKERVDMVARAHAMLKIVREERALAEEEEQAERSREQGSQKDR